MGCTVFRDSCLAIPFVVILAVLFSIRSESFPSGYSCKSSSSDQHGHHLGGAFPRICFSDTRSRYTVAPFQKPFEKQVFVLVGSRNTEVSFLIASKTPCFHLVVWRQEGGGDWEEGSAGLTVFAARQSNVFCVPTRPAAWHIFWTPVS